MREETLTVRQALLEGTRFLSQMGVESARLDAELLLGQVLGGGREGLYLSYEMPLASYARDLFQSLLQRRARREPIAYITGEREFWSLDLLVTPEVLVPRPETELLVEVALRLIRQSQISDFKFHILDLGTGSGAIAVSLARELTDVEIWATDVSSEALKIAQANARRHRVKDRIHFLRGDIFEPLIDLRGLFHVIVSNPPYVRRGEIEDLPPEVRDWEPGWALDGGLDGLDFYRRIIQEGHLYLAGGGFMALEIAADMGKEVSQLFARVGRYSLASVYQDYAARDRVVVARKLPSPSGLQISNLKLQI